MYVGIPKPPNLTAYSEPNRIFTAKKLAGQKTARKTSYLWTKVVPIAKDAGNNNNYFISQIRNIQ